MISPPCSRREKALWLLLILAALVLRFIALGHRAMSHDESLHALYSWYLSNGLNYEHNPMMHGPLLFHLNGLLYSILPVNDFTSLIIPALWGTGCVGLLFLYRRWLGKSGALVAAALVMIEPAHLFYSRYLRNDITVSFFTLLMVWAVLDYRDTLKKRSLLWMAVGLGFQFVTKETSFIIGTVLGCSCLFFAGIETRRLSMKAWRKQVFHHPLMHCAMLLLLLALPFAGALIHPLLGWDPLDNRTATGQTRILGIAGILYVCTAVAGTYYFIKENLFETFAKSFGIFWGVQVLLYSTLLTNTAQGLSSGIAGSLGYWLSQHEVNRGNPDPFFYITLLLLYCPVLLVASGLRLRWIKQDSLKILWFWLVGNLLIYSWAGERMPWLVMHITLPLCLLSGMSIAHLFRNPGRKWVKAIILLGCFQLVSNSLRVNGPLSEGASEPLMYAHSGPDIKTSILLIEEHLKKRPGSKITVDNMYSWPMAWYFRDANLEYKDVKEMAISEDASVLLAPPSMENHLQENGWTSRMRVDMTTWPRPHYHRITVKNIKGLLLNPTVRKKFIRYYLFRDQPEWGENEWPVPNRYVLMTR